MQGNSEKKIYSMLIAWVKIQQKLLLVSNISALVPSESASCSWMLEFPVAFPCSGYGYGGGVGDSKGYRIWQSKLEGDHNTVID